MSASIETRHIKRRARWGEQKYGETAAKSNQDISNSRHIQWRGKVGGPKPSELQREVMKREGV